jgi:rubrerythrin
MAGENQTHDYYMTVGPTFSDPIARQLYAEIASIEEQHVTQYESIIDPTETWLEKWLMHEATEVYNYWSCFEQEDDRRAKSIWERFLAYELGHLHFVMELMKTVENRDPAELLPGTLPQPIQYKSQRDFVRQTLEAEVDLRAKGALFVPAEEEPQDSIAYRTQLHSQGIASETVAIGYRWSPGTELRERGAQLRNGRQS